MCDMLHVVMTWDVHKPEPVTCTHVATCVCINNKHNMQARERGSCWASCNVYYHYNLCTAPQSQWSSYWLLLCSLKLSLHVFTSQVYFECLARMTVRVREAWTECFIIMIKWLLSTLRERVCWTGDSSVSPQTSDTPEFPSSHFFVKEYIGTLSDLKQGAISGQYLWGVSCKLEPLSRL